MTVFVVAILVTLGSGQEPLTLPPVEVEAKRPDFRVHSLAEVLPESVVRLLEHAGTGEGELLLLLPYVASNYRARGDTTRWATFSGYPVVYEGIVVGPEQLEDLAGVLLKPTNYTRAKSSCTTTARAALVMEIDGQVLDILLTQSCSGILWWLNGEYGHARLGMGSGAVSSWFWRACPDSLEDWAERYKWSSNLPLQPSPARGEGEGR
jgi:hypothetical protein